MDTFASFITAANERIMRHPKRVYGIVPLSAAVMLLWNLRNAYEKGKILSISRYSSRVYSRADEPVTFWTAVAFNLFCLAFALGSLIVPWR